MNNDHPPLIAKLLATPGAFALPQAVEIATRYLRVIGETFDAETFRYRVNPALSFPPGDLDSLVFRYANDAPAQVEITLNLMGLHGVGSPLPAYFTEYVAQHAEGADGLRDFFDIFNHSLIDLLYQTWRKYRYYARYEPQASDRLSNRFFGFMGAGNQEIRQAGRLKWPRLMTYLGLIAFNSLSVESLEAILRHYFAHPHIDIIPCIRRWVAIPAEQQTRLGEGNNLLGENFLAGLEMEDQTGKFRISITRLGWEQYNAFLPTGEKYAELKSLARFLLRSRLAFDVELRLLPEEIRPWRLEMDGDSCLGWSTWAGDEGDGAVVLDIGQEPL